MNLTKLTGNKMKLLDQAEANLMLMKMHAAVMKLKVSVAKQDQELVAVALTELYTLQSEQRNMMQFDEPTEAANDGNATPEEKEEDTETCPG